MLVFTVICAVIALLVYRVDRDLQKTIRELHKVQSIAHQKEEVEKEREVFVTQVPQSANNVDVQVILHMEIQPEVHVTQAQYEDVEQWMLKNNKKVNRPEDLLNIYINQVLPEYFKKYEIPDDVDTRFFGWLIGPLGLKNKMDEHKNRWVHHMPKKYIEMYKEYTNFCNYWDALDKTQ